MAINEEIFFNYKPLSDNLENIHESVSSIPVEVKSSTSNHLCY